MKYRAAIAALLVVCASFGAVAVAAASELRASIAEYGRYETKRTGKTERAERTASGERYLADAHRFLERSDVIVGQLGNTFGVEVRFEDFPAGAADITVRRLHPPLTNPKTGKTTTVSEYDINVTTGQSSHFWFSFDESWEIAEGPWTLQIVHNGRVIAEKTFKIVVPLN